MIALEKVLTTEEVAAVLEALELADFEDGKTTAGGAAADVKHNLQLKRTSAEPLPLDQLIINALTKHGLMQAYGFPKTFSAPIFSKYTPGMKYGAHVDSPIRSGSTLFRTDLSMTLFLSNPISYDGGELLIETDAGPKKIKLPAGHAIVYPTFAVHQVLEVTRGVRMAAVTWCQSLVRDPQMRRVLFEYTKLNQLLHADDSDSPAAALSRNTLNNLTRLLIDP